MVKDDSLLTTRQLQQLLQVDRITIYRMLNDGRLRGFKVGGQWRFSRDAIDRWLQEQQANLEVRHAPAADDRLQPSTLLPLSCIQAIQEVFAEALGVGALTTAPDGTPMTPMANPCEFCTLILDTDEGHKRCVASWEATAATPGDTPREAVCHAGLRHLWGRVQVRGSFIATLHVGQFLTQRPVADAGWQGRLTRLSHDCGIPHEQLREALDAVAVPTVERQRQIPHMLLRVAETFSQIGEERLNLLARLRRISEISTL